MRAYGDTWCDYGQHIWVREEGQWRCTVCQTVEKDAR